jgi:uncharacterized DUF497 family protein
MDHSRDDGYKFAWTANKSRANLIVHGVTFQEAETVFYDPLAEFAPDAWHSVEEARGILIGVSDRQHLLFVSFTERDGLVRIISARLATAKERRDYEQAFPW